MKTVYSLLYGMLFLLCACGQSIDVCMLDDLSLKV